MIGFLRYWRRHYAYQRQQLGAPPLIACYDSLCDAWLVWQTRKKHGL